MNTKEYLSNYYQNYDEEGRLLSKHGMVEYITTMKYIERYLQPGMRIMEIGAATGRYSHALARKGYQVDAVDHIDDAMYDLYLKYHLATCERQDMIGYSHHTLDIFRKD